MVSAGRVLLPVATAAALLFGAACSPAEPEPAPVDSPTPSPSATATIPPNTPIRTNARPGGSSLLPSDISDEATRRVATLIYRSLFAQDSKAALVPGVATAIVPTVAGQADQTTAPDDGGALGQDRPAAEGPGPGAGTPTDARTATAGPPTYTEWTVTLDPKAQFADGTPIDAQTLADSWAFTAARTQQTRVSTPLAFVQGYPGDGDSLSGVNVVAPTTLRLTLVDSVPQFDSLAADLTLVPVPRQHRENPEHGATNPIGNGPYVLKDTWTGAGSYLLQPNPVYTGPETPANSGIQFHTFDTLDEAYAALTAGRLDLIDELPPGAADTTDGQNPTQATSPKLTTLQQPVGAVQSIDFPASDPDWGQGSRTRRAALSLAVDRAGIAQSTLAGARAPAGDLGAPTVDGYTADLCGELCEQDPERARELWRAAGPVPVTIAYNADGTAGAAATAVCHNLTEVLGATCRTHAYASESELAAAVASGEVGGPYLRSWTMRQRTLGGFLVPRFLAGAAENWNGYTAPLAQTQLRVAMRSPASTSAAAFQEAERLLLQDLPSVPLWSVNATTTSAATVTGVVTDATGTPVYGLVARSTP